MNKIKDKLKNLLTPRSIKMAKWTSEVEQYLRDELHYPGCEYNYPFKFSWSKNKRGNKLYLNIEYIPSKDDAVKKIFADFFNQNFYNILITTINDELIETLKLFTIHSYDVKKILELFPEKNNQLCGINIVGFGYIKSSNRKFIDFKKDKKDILATIIFPLIGDICETNIIPDYNFMNTKRLIINDIKIYENLKTVETLIKLYKDKLIY